MSMPSNRAASSVVATTWGLMALLLGHDLSHALDDGLETSLTGLLLVAVPQWLALAAVMAIVLRAQRPMAHVAAVLFGLGVSLGLVAVHLLPVSVAPYEELDPSAISWLLAWVPAVVGVALAGLAVARRTA